MRKLIFSFFAVLLAGQAWGTQQQTFVAINGITYRIPAFAVTGRQGSSMDATVMQGCGENLAILDIVNNHTVSGISSNAFKDCQQLTSITIPNTIKTIGSEAFSGCTSLTSVTIPSSVSSISSNTFNGCTSLASVTIPTSVTSIGSNAFSGCTGLTELTIPTSVTSIGDGAFSDVQRVVYAGTVNRGEYGASNAVAEFELGGSDGKTLVKYNGAGGDVVIPDGIDAISAGAFSGYNNITQVFVPSSVNSIGDCAFSGIPKVVYSGNADGRPWCADEVVGASDFVLSSDGKTLLKYYGAGGNVNNIPATITAIGDNAFKDCSTITSVVIPSSVVSIGAAAFFYCTGMQSVNIPNGVSYIGNDAFNNCYSLTSIIIPSSVSIIEDRTFSGCGGLTEITIPESVVSIGNNAFAYCGSLASVTMPVSYSVGTGVFYNSNSVEYIMQNGIKYHVTENDFENNVNYKAEVIANSQPYSGAVVIADTITLSSDRKYAVTKIGEQAFYNCSELESVIIPNTVKAIGEEAFAYCINMPTVTIPKSVESIGENAFLGINTIVLLKEYPADNIITWGANNWSMNYLLSDDGKELQQVFFGDTYPTEIWIPHGVETIANGVFSGYNKLESVHIPNTVKTIGDNAFQGCTAIESLTVPPTVEEIGENAFVGVQSVTYKGYATGSPWGVNEAVLTDNASDFTFADDKKTILLKYIGGDGVAYIPNTVKTISSNAFRGNNDLTSVYIPESVETIGSEAFMDCDNLESINIPSSVTSIGDNAFSKCDKLKNINVDDENQNYTSFDGVLFSGDMKSLICYPAGKTETTYEIIEGVEEICGLAFDGCTNLTEITIPSTVEKIGPQAFSGCTNLTKVVLLSDNTVIDPTAFEGLDNLTDIDFSYIIKDGIRYHILSDDEVEVTSYWTWYTGNSYNGSVVIPESVLLGEKTYLVTRIGESAFYYSSLTAIDIPSSVTSIGDWAFDRCPLESIVIPESVESIGEGALQMCFNLTSVAIPESVKTIGDNAFAGSNSITSVSIESDADFSNAELYFTQDGIRYHVLNKNKVEVVAVNDPNSYSGNVVIPQKVGTFTVTAIGDEAFKGCESLTSITIPESVESIGESAFEDCQSLTSIVIPESVKTVADYAFRNCTNLSEVTYNPATTTISENAFEGTKVIMQKPETEGFVYEPSGNKQVTIISYNGTVPETLIIRDKATIDGVEYKVTGIAEGAFAGSNIVELTIPASVTEIDETAFKDCNKLKTLTYNSNGVGKCFAGCQSLENVTIGSNVKGIDAEAFKNCINLKSVTIEISGIIGEKAFYNCHGLESVSIGGSVTHIGNEAFRGCHKIKTIEVPQLVSGIGEDAFKYVKNVEYEGNAKGEPWGALTVNGYKEGDFFFTDATKKCLTAYVGSGSAAEVPSTVTVIAHMAFFEAEGLKSVTIHGSVKKIENLAFANCFDLKDVNIPSSVLYIGKEAFRDSRSAVISCAASKKPTAWHGEWAIKVGKIQWNQPDDTVGVGIADDAALSVVIYATNNTIVVENATDEIRVYDSMGRLVCRDAIYCVRAEITVNTSGVYIVKTGNVAKRVVMK